MRYEKAETVLRVALAMQGSALGTSIDDIRRDFTDKPLSRRTAERLRDAVERVFPHMGIANPGELPRRWRLPGRAVNGLAHLTADELAHLSTAAELLRRENLTEQAKSIERLIDKLRVHLKPLALAHIEPDLEALTEAEGLAMRPGPRPKINAEAVHRLREAILAGKKVRVDCVYRGTGRRGFETVHPYGFLYGNRSYLVAWSENQQALDFRSYALSGIERVEMLEQSFRKRRFSLKEYAERSFGVFQEKPVDVVWKFSPSAAADAREFLFHPTQQMTPQRDGSLIVRFRAGGLQEMAWHLATWGREVKVLKPRKLAAMVHRAR